MDVRPIIRLWRVDRSPTMVMDDVLSQSRWSVSEIFENNGPHHALSLSTLKGVARLHHIHLLCKCLVC